MEQNVEVIKKTSGVGKKIFISSTCFDLRDLRAELAEALKEWGYLPIWNESPNFPIKHGLHSHDVCLDVVKECDIYLLIIDKRYGGTYAGNKYPKEDISITWYETKIAFQEKKEMYIFVRDEVWNERVTYKKNLKEGIQIKPHHVENPKVFEFIDFIVHQPRDNWIETFKNSVELKEKLKIRLKSNKEGIIDPCYEDYFKKIALLRQREFEYLGYWVDLYAIETKLASIKEEEKGRIDKAMEVINRCITQGRNAVIFGSSGAGKTFMCLKLFEDFKERYYIQPTDAHIPIFIELSRLKDSRLEEFIISSCGIDKDIFMRDKDKYIIFLDGLNETGNKAKQKLIFSEIVRFGILNPKTKLFVTTQVIDEGYGKAPAFELYEIAQLREEDVIEYMSKFKDKFPSKEEAIKFYDGLSYLMKTSITTPIFLYILVSIYEKDKGLKISNLSNLLQRYVDFLCRLREPQLAPSVMDEDYRKKILPYVAFNICKNNEKDIPWERFNKYIQDYKKETYSPSINEQEIRETITHRFKLMKENGGYLEFVHQMVRDYFAAVYLWDKGYSLKEILKLAYPTKSIRNDDIINCLRLLVGLHSSSTSKSIIQGFISKDLYLACELFAWSSISEFDEGFIANIAKKVDINSREYLLSLNEVISFYLKVLDLIKEANKEKEPVYAFYLRFLGSAYYNKLDYDKAIDGLKKAISIYEENRMQNHPDYARCHVNLGVAYEKKLDYDKAIDEYKKAISIYEENRMQNHPDYAKCQMNLGNAYADKLDYDKAIDCYKKAISIYEENNMQNHPDYARCHANLGIAYSDKSDYDKAIDEYNKAISIYEENNMQNHPSYALCHMNLGNVYYSKLDYDKAINEYKKAISIYEGNNMQNHPDYALCHMNLGIAYWSKLDYDNAIDEFKKAISIYEENRMQNHPEYAKCHMNLGIAYDKIGKKEEAIRCLRFALEIFKQTLPKEHPLYQECLKNLKEIE